MKFLTETIFYVMSNVDLDGNIPLCLFCRKVKNSLLLNMDNGHSYAIIFLDLEVVYSEHFYPDSLWLLFF